VQNVIENNLSLNRQWSDGKLHSEQANQAIDVAHGALVVTLRTCCVNPLAQVDTPDVENPKRMLPPDVIF